MDSVESLRRRTIGKEHQIQAPLPRRYLDDSGWGGGQGISLFFSARMKCGPGVNNWVWNAFLAFPQRVTLIWQRRRNAPTAAEAAHLVSEWRRED